MTGDTTCILCRGDDVLITSARGIRPLLQWLDSDIRTDGFYAADRVVGRGAAFLYRLLA